MNLDEQLKKAIRSSEAIKNLDAEEMVIDMMEIMTDEAKTKLLVALNEEVAGNLAMEKKYGKAAIDLAREMAEKDGPAERARIREAVF